MGHSLAGAIIHLSSDPVNRDRHQNLWWLILAANLADFDLIPGLLVSDDGLFHRTFSHSLCAALLFAVVVYALCGWKSHPRPAQMTLLMFSAYLSHLLLDWLNLDPGQLAGIPLFWPFSKEYYMADPTLFMNIERHALFSVAVAIHDLKAVLLEIAILGPPAVLLWWWRRR